MMFISTQHRSSSDSSYHFCHICNSRKANNQIYKTESGDLKCLTCQQTGFVEIVNSGTNDRPNTFHSQRTPQASRPEPRRQTTSQGYNDPFASVFGVPLDSFVDSIFQGSFAFPMTSVDTSVPIDVRFNRDFSNFFGSAFSSFFSTGRTTGTNGPPTDPEFSRIFNNLLVNPYNEQAMNQILQYVMENDPNSYGSPPAAKKVVEALKEIVLTKDKATEYGTCAICTEDFKENDRVHMLVEDTSLCGHPFHVDCIIPWLKQHNSCPVCRFELPTDDENYNKQREYLRTRIAQEVQRNASTRTNPPSSNSPNA